MTRASPIRSPHPPWRDQAGRPRTLASLAGKVRVLAMVYTRCTHTCPEIIVELKRIEARLPPADRGEAGFVLVSLDPRRDTPARLHEFAASMRLDSARWTLLTGGKEGAGRAAASLPAEGRLADSALERVTCAGPGDTYHLPPAQAG